MKLANYLTNDYEIKSGKVVRKTDLIAKVGEERYTLDRNNDVWVLTGFSRNDKDTVVTASTIVNHSALIKLAKNVGMNLKDIKYSWLQIPSQDNNMHSIVSCEYDNCPPIIGEANLNNLKGAMSSYSATMALKRGIDRIITHYTGLYENGVYSSSELGGPGFGGEEEAEETPVNRNDILEYLRGKVRDGAVDRYVLEDALCTIAGKKTSISYAKNADLIKLVEWVDSNC